MKLELEVTQSTPQGPASPEQLAVYDWVRDGTGNLILEAVAGSGKTTTLRESCRLMSGDVAFAAFNKKIADEIAYKLKAGGVGSNVQSKTFHSYGFSAWRRFAPRVKVDADKIRGIMDDLDVPDNLQVVVSKLVSLGKSHLVGCGKIELRDELYWASIIDHFEIGTYNEDENDDEWEVKLIRRTIDVLKESNEQCEDIIDFDDMIYAPLLHRLKVPTNDWVLIDEAQDTNPSRRELAKEMLAPGGRLIAVGDPHQAIYGFTGASADALDIIERELDCIRLPLTFTWRCPKAVVREAQRFVPHIQAPDYAKEGTVETMDDRTFYNQMRSIQRDDAILCRLTRPLISLAYTFIRDKIPCHVEGREIGKGLVALTRRYRTTDPAKMMEKLDDWADHQRGKLIARHREREAEALMDKVETIRIFVENLREGATVSDLQHEINALFDDTPDGGRPRNITLSTVHKAKGREWPTVFIWGRDAYMPSKFAKQDWQLEQEYNLIYVAVTRAQEKLVFVNIGEG